MVGQTRILGDQGKWYAWLKRAGGKDPVLLDKARTYRKIFIEFVVGMPIVLASVPLPREYWIRNDL